MSRYKYYQPNEKDLKDREGDCSIRALTKFHNSTWLEEFDRLVKYARETQTTINSLTNIKRLFADEGVPYISIWKNKVSVDSFVRSHKAGTYILYCKVGYGMHLVAVKDGTYYDTWDCGDRYVYGYWKKEDAKNA